MTATKVKMNKEEIVKEKDCWERLFPLVSKMNTFDSFVLKGKNVFTSIT